MKSGWLVKMGILLGTVLLLSACGKADSAYREGMKLAGDGKYEKALSQFQKAVKEDSKVAEYHIGYGMTYNYMGKYGEAEKIFSAAMDKLSETASKEEKKQFYYGDAMAYCGMGEYEQATAYCDKALKIESPGDIDADIYYTKAVCLENQGKYKEAENVLKKLIDNNKKDWQAYYDLAAVQELQGKTEDAVGTYQILTEDEDGDGSAHFALYELYQKLGETNAADEVLEKILSKNLKKASNALAAGRAYYCKKDMEMARKYMEQAYDGNCMESLYYLGVLYMNQKNYPEAESKFLSYIRECKDDDIKAEAYSQLAAAYMEQKDYEKAGHYLDQGREHGLLGADRDLRECRVMLYERQNMYEEAKEEALQYIKRYPADNNMKKELAFIKTRIK